jgi:outer membrane protein
MRPAMNLKRTAIQLLTAASIGLGGLVVAPATAHADVPEIKKLALIDMQRVLNETKQGKKARAKLEKSSSAKQKKLESKRNKLEQETGKLKGLGGPQLQAAQEDLQRQYMELQQMYMTLQQELAVQESELLEQIYKNSQSIVGSMAKENGVDLVLIRDETTVIYAADSLDLTADLVKRYDKKYP